MSIISNSSTKEVELDAITETEDLLPSVQTGIDVPVLWVTQDDPLAQVPISVISQCKELIYAIDRRQVMIDAQLLKNTEQFILMKNIQIPTDLNKLYNTGKGLDFNDLGRVLFTKNDQGSIEFVENTNSMLKDAMEAEEKTIRRISAISLVPVDYLGIESAQGNIGAGSRTLLHGAFIKAVEDIRELFGETFKEINEIIAAQNPDIDPTFTWEDVFAKSDDEVVAELKVAVESGLLPLKRAIMEYQGITEEEAQLQVDERMEAAMAIQETTVEETTEEEETV